MSWLIALAGGALGFYIGGLSGAILGAVLGYMLGGGSDWLRLGGGFGSAAHVQNAFFSTTFLVMGHIAKADGRVSEREIAAARAVMARMNLDAAQRDAAIRFFRRGKQPDFELKTVLARFRRDSYRRRDVLRVFVEIQLNAALADGEIHSVERAILETICAELGISRAELARLEQMARGQRPGGAASPDRVSLAQSYKVLGVKPDASDAEVKKAYRRLLQQHHPDKLVAKGLPREMMEVAEEKTQQVIEAYDRIKDARGMK